MILYQQGAVAHLSMPLLVHEILVPLRFLRQALNGCWCTRGSKSQFLGIGLGMGLASA